MKILLAADSWGVGVFSETETGYGPTGEGIAPILNNEYDDYQIVNVSVAGASNKEIVRNIRLNLTDDFDAIIFIQTDPFREHSKFKNSFKILSTTFLDSLIKDYKNLEEFFNEYYNNLYNELNKFNKTVICIGGWSKLHPAIKQYENLKNVIPSATKIIIPKLEEDVYLSDFEWFPQLNDYPGFLHQFPEVKQIAIASSQKFELLCNYCGDCHPDVNGYKVLAKNIHNYLLRDK